MSDDAKPDLTSYTPEVREALLARRAYWRAKRGLPTEIWTNERLIDRDEHIVSEAIKQVVAAVAPTISESAAPEQSTEAPDPAVEPRTAAPARPYKEMTLDEFQAASSGPLSAMFGTLAEDRKQPGSPFWRSLVTPADPDSTNG